MAQRTSSRLRLSGLSPLDTRELLANLHMKQSQSQLSVLDTTSLVDTREMYQNNRESSGLQYILSTLLDFVTHHGQNVPSNSKASFRSRLSIEE